MFPSKNPGSYIQQPGFFISAQRINVIKAYDLLVYTFYFKTCSYTFHFVYDLSAVFYLFSASTKVLSV